MDYEVCLIRDKNKEILQKLNLKKYANDVKDLIIRIEKKDENEKHKWVRIAFYKDNSFIDMKEYSGVIATSKNKYNYVLSEIYKII